jgi:hypothetical protein
LTREVTQFIFSHDFGSNRRDHLRESAQGHRGPTNHAGGLSREVLVIVNGTHDLLTVQPSPPIAAEPKGPLGPVPSTSFSNTAWSRTACLIWVQVIDLRRTFMRRSQIQRGTPGPPGRQSFGRQLRYRNLSAVPPCTNGPKKFGSLLAGFRRTRHSHSN